MGFRINTNIGALSAHASATMNNRALDSSLSKLNTGFRITCAADDASGMAIADSLRSQANALGQAIMNANDAIGVIQTADKAMDEQIKILDTIKTKAIQAAQDTQTTETRRALQADINRLMEQLDNIGNTTSFNGQKLLSGAFSNKEFQIGAYSNETIKASIGPTTSDKIGLTRFETGHNVRYSDIIGDPDAPSDGKLTLTFKQADGINDIQLEPVKFATMKADENGKVKIDVAVGQGLGALAEAINKASDVTGIRANANVTSVFAHVISAGSTTEGFAINGVTIGKVAVMDKDANGALRAAINHVKDQTGVEASVDNRGRLVLANRDGRGIVVEDGALPDLPGELPPEDNKRPTPPESAEEASAAIEGLLDDIEGKKPNLGVVAGAQLQGDFGANQISVDKAKNKLNVAAATGKDIGNENSLKSIAEQMAKTNLQSMSQASGKEAMLQALQATTGVELSRALEDGFDLNNLDISALSFSNNLDLDAAGLFGTYDAAVGNLDGIRGAKNLQEISDEIRAGMSQLDKNIELLSADSQKIGDNGTLTAQRMAVMIDRRAQLEGMLEGVAKAGAAWAQNIDYTSVPDPKGVKVERSENEELTAPNERFCFKTIDDASLPDGKVTSVELKPIALKQPSMKHYKAAANSLASSTHEPVEFTNKQGTALDVNAEIAAGYKVSQSTENAKITVDESDKTVVKGIAALFVGNEQNTVKYSKVAQDLTDAGVMDFIKQTAKAKLLSTLNTQLASGKIDLSADGLFKTGDLGDIGSKIFTENNAYSAYDLSSNANFSALKTAKSIDEIDAALKNITVPAASKTDIALGAGTTSDSDKITMEEMRANLGYDAARAELEGFKEAISELKTAAIKEANSTLSEAQIESGLAHAPRGLSEEPVPGTWLPTAAADLASVNVSKFYSSTPTDVTIATLKADFENALANYDEQLPASKTALAHSAQRYQKALGQMKDVVASEQKTALSKKIIANENNDGAWLKANDGIKTKIDSLHTKALQTLNEQLLNTTLGGSLNGAALVEMTKNLSAAIGQDGALHDSWSALAPKSGPTQDQFKTAFNALAAAADKLNGASTITAENAADWKQFFDDVAKVTADNLTDTVPEPPERPTAGEISSAMANGVDTSTRTLANYVAGMKVLISKLTGEKNSSGTSFQVGIALEDYLKVAAVKELADSVKINTTEGPDYGKLTWGDATTALDDGNGLKKDTWETSLTAVDGNLGQRMTGSVYTPIAFDSAVSNALTELKTAKKNYDDIVAAEAKKNANTSADASKFDQIEQAADKAAHLNYLQDQIQTQIKSVTKLSAADFGADAAALGKVGGKALEAYNAAKHNDVVPEAAKAPEKPASSEPSYSAGISSEQAVAANGNIPTLDATTAAKPLESEDYSTGLSGAKDDLGAALDKYTSAKAEGTLTNKEHKNLALAAQKYQLGIDQLAKGVEQKAAQKAKDAASDVASDKWAKEAMNLAATAAAQALQATTYGGGTVQVNESSKTVPALSIAKVISQAKALYTELGGVVRAGSLQLEGWTDAEQFKTALGKVAALDVSKITAENVTEVLGKVSEAFRGLDIDAFMGEAGKAPAGEKLGTNGDWDAFKTAVGGIKEALKDSGSLDELSSNINAVKFVAEQVSVDPTTAQIGKNKLTSTADITLTDGQLERANEAAKALNGDNALTNTLPNTATELKNNLQTVADAADVLKKVQDIIKDPTLANAAVAGEFDDEATSLVDKISILMNDRKALEKLIAPSGLTLGQLGADDKNIGQLPIGELAAMLPDGPLNAERYEEVVPDNYRPVALPKHFSEAGEEVLELIDERTPAKTDLAALLAGKFGAASDAPKAERGKTPDEVVDLRKVLGGEKTTVDLPKLLGMLDKTGVFSDIHDRAETTMITLLAGAIGNNIDGQIEPLVGLRFAHSIGGEWQHPELPQSVTNARTLDDLKDALSELKENMSFPGLKLPKSADEAAQQRTVVEDELENALNANNPELVKSARKKLANLDAMAQIDGWLKAVDGVAEQLEAIRLDRADNGHSLADIIGLTQENSVNFGRLSLVGQGAKDIQVVLTDAAGNDMTAAAGFDRDVAEKTVSLRETNAKTERDVAAAQGFNAEDWMDTSTDEHRNGYPAGVMTFKGAQAMIDIAEVAQKALEAIRSDLGSVQNQLVVTINNISVTQVNVKQAESNIRDVDFAQESATFSKHQILAQSGVYAMSQANAVQQNVMKLLQ